MEMDGTSKNEQIFLCKICDYTCRRKYNLERHLSTGKHIFSHNWKSKRVKRATPNLLICECGQSYDTHSGLWKHKKKCLQNLDVLNNSVKPDKNNTAIMNTETTSIQNIDTSNLTQLFLETVKQNQDFQKQMFELVKDNIGTHHINSHNKTTNNQFNLNFFLNETCKDAMNINDFIEYVKVNLDDFENFGRVGYPKALGEIIVRNLNELDVKMRPIHCSDLKREILHVKHDGVWHSDESREFMKRSIMYIAHKNIKQIPMWQEHNPESKNCQTKTFDRYNKMFRASLGPENEEEKLEFLKKITNIIAKEVVIDKKKKYD